MKKKICMVGLYGVGKTSLVRRYLMSIFDEKYLTTIGVKVDKKEVDVNGATVSLAIWDIAGEDVMSQVKLSHLRGAHGYILVADGLRRASLEKADELNRRIAEEFKQELPFIFVVNKSDLREKWEIQPADLDERRARGWEYYETSARTGVDVDRVFERLTEKMLEQDSVLTRDASDDD